MKKFLNELYDYQWELTLTGAQLDEAVLRCRCSASTEAAIRGQCRSLIITASEIKYELIALEQELLNEPLEKGLQIIKLRESFSEMEHALFLIIRNYVNLMASLEEKPEDAEALIALKDFWPKLAETYQFFKNILVDAEQNSN